MPEDSRNSNRHLDRSSTISVEMELISLFVSVLFYSNSLYVVGFTMIGTIISFSLSKMQKKRPLPKILKNCLNKIGKWLLLDQSTVEVEPPNIPLILYQLTNYLFLDAHKKSG